MDNLVAVVTGGTRGIGLGIAEKLVRRGYSLAVTYRENDKLADLARQRLNRIKTGEQQFLALRGDAGDAEVVADHHATILRELGRVRVLVNNAGMMQIKPFEEISPRDWDETIRMNLNSAFYWCREVVPGMKEMHEGRIVNISSLAAWGGGVIGPHYAASKAGMMGLTRYAAKELGPHGITVNSIAPAFIVDAGVFAEWPEERRAKLKEKVFVPRLGTVEDVARTFEYLLDSPFVTGETLDVNGGAFMI